MSELTAKEEAFAQAFVFNGGNATDAWRTAHPNSKAKPETQHVKASVMANTDRVKVRISQLKKKAAAKAENDFGVSVEWRLQMLKEIVEAGKGVYQDSNGQRRTENLAAARGAIQTINDMLGVALPGEKGKRKSFSVNLRIEDASAESDGDNDE